MSEKRSESENLGPYPIAESLLQAFGRKMNPTSEESDAAREVLETAFEQEVHHIERYKNDTGTAAFPYQHLQLSELRDQLLSREHREIPIKKLIFTMASARGVKAGHPFIFAEEALRGVLRKLPTALKDEEPGDVHAFTLGSPTNYWGEISPEFVEDMKDDAFGALGDLYTEFIEKKLKEHPEVQTVELIGVSMGGLMAMKTAERLLKAGVVQRLKDVETEEEKDANGVPTLRVKIMSPAGIDHTALSSVQLPVGFVADGFLGAVMQPWLLNILYHEKAFFPRIQKLLGWKGFGDTKAPDISLKKQAVRSLMHDLIWKGNTIPAGVRPDILRGTKDASSYSPAFNYAAAKQAEKHTGSLAQPLVKDASDRREWAINYGHMPPYSSEHEMRRLQHIARTLIKERGILPE